MLTKKRLPLSATLIATAIAALLASCGYDSTAAATACQAISSDGTTVIVGANQPGDPALPEPASGYRTGLKTTYSHNYMVSTSNAFASAAGCAVLQRGGAAADAGVAVQAVLGLTVPEATGLGSGGFMLYYDAGKKVVETNDGRESAPAAATENYLRWIDDVTDHTTPKPSARASGRSIGTIGVPRLIEAVQKDHGKLAWKSVESSMGSFHMTHGFLLNNQLTDFSASPTDGTGAPIANKLSPGKRPRSSMGDFFMATGSPGGGTIPQYLLKTLVGVLDWGLDAQQASNLIDFGASNGPTTTIGGEHPDVDTTNSGANDALITGLKALGHTVSTSAQSSGVNTVMRVQINGSPALAGGTDPRREGVVLGDTFVP